MHPHRPSWVKGLTNRVKTRRSNFDSFAKLTWRPYQLTLFTYTSPCCWAFRLLRSSYLSSKCGISRKGKLKYLSLSAILNTMLYVWQSWQDAQFYVVHGHRWQNVNHICYKMLRQKKNVFGHFGWSLCFLPLSNRLHLVESVIRTFKMGCNIWETVTFIDQNLS
jgi:hypothetical protein